LTRTEVRGGGKKPWRQKHTGKARQGSTRAPQWIKGGVVFAPKPRDFSKKVNKRAKRAALVSVLSGKVADGELLVLDQLALVEAKTKEVANVLKALKLEKSVLLVLDGAQDNTAILRASANIPALTTVAADLINVYDVAAHANVVATKAAIEKIEEAYKA
jgi:large subunit ribosomal protein L4